MASELDILPARRPELIIRPMGEPGVFVIKNQRNRSFLRVGEMEQFLLLGLDGRQTEADLQRSFEARFRESLSRADIVEFIQLAKGRDLLQGEPGEAVAAASDEDDEEDPLAGVKPGGKRQSLLYCRYSVFDPDALFTRLEPWLRFVWTPIFILITLAMIATAAGITWTHGAELATSFSNRFTWETAVLFWITLIGVTTLHEFAHGLTCKHHGGEVHELGVLLVFFMPCFYCNVSDAWLLPEKSKRLWITAAGGYCDLCLWAVAVFIWRLTMPDTLVNYLAWVVMNVCGSRGLINLNPLLRLDGYYLLSDLLDVSNMRSRSQSRWMGWVRWALWGGSRPAAIKGGTKLTAYGAFVWSCGTVFLTFMLVRFARSLGDRWGLVGVVLATGFCLWIISRVWRGFFSNEVSIMIMRRPLRTACWLIAILVGGTLASQCKITDQTSGAFHVRPGNRVEVRSPVAGFLRAVHVDEGDRISSGGAIGRMEIPDLESHIAQKSAEVHETQANLKRLLAGPRPEEVREQQLKVERAIAWRDMAQADLARTRQSWQEELNRFDQLLDQYRTEVEYTAASLKQATKLYEQGGLAGQQYLAERKRYDVAVSQYQQTQSQRRAREIGGTIEAESEVARRTKDFADVEAAQKLLEAGTRPEQIEAEQARLARLNEELRFLTSQRPKLDICSPISGFLTTVRMTEKVGQYFEKGALICVIEDCNGLEAEIAIPEQDVAGVKSGQLVELKARSRPFEIFRAKVDRIAPRANRAEGSIQGTVTLYCRLAQSDANLLAGMTGVGRVTRGKDSTVGIASRKLLQYVRTEFWW